MDTDGSHAVLVVDVANRLTRLGLFASGEPLDTQTMSTPAHLTTDEVRSQVAAFLAREHVRAALTQAQEEPSGEKAPNAPHGAILSCVVPPHVDPWAQALREVARQRALVVGPGLKTGMRMRMEHPAEVGSDRVANAVAARVLLGAPVVVVALGTTTGIEVIDATGAFVGGTIAPGLMMSLRSLNEVAARLPLVEPRVPRSVTGKNTREAIQAGVVLGEAARVDGLLDRIMDQLGQEAPVVVTGHHAAMVSPLLKHTVHVDEELTLRGLDLIWHANRTRA